MTLITQDCKLVQQDSRLYEFYLEPLTCVLNRIKAIISSINLTYIIKINSKCVLSPTEGKTSVSYIALQIKMHFYRDIHTITKSEIKFSFYALKYSPHRKILQIGFVDLNHFCIYYLQFSRAISRLWKNRHISISSSCKVEFMFDRYRPKFKLLSEFRVQISNAKFIRNPISRFRIMTRRVTDDFHIVHSL